MGRFAIGQAFRRVEDQRFLTGQGTFTDDIQTAGAAASWVLRSPYGHGTITALDVAEAQEMPGVLGVYTIADLDAAGLGDMPVTARPTGADGGAMPVPPRPILARGLVRHVGEPIAFVVAETVEAARTAAEAIVFEVDTLPAVASLKAAVAEGAPQLWPDLAPGNTLLAWHLGDKAATEAAFAGASRVVALDLVNQRLAPTPMELRATIGSYDPAGDRYTLITGSQGSHSLQKALATAIFHVAPEKIHVISPDVGGGFGLRLFVFPEQALVLFAAKALGRPVKWLGDRTEALTGDLHSRDHVTHAELALDDQARFLGLRVKTLANVGAYVSQYGAFIPTQAGTGMLTGVYAIPVAFAEVKLVVTNTTPVDAYRGAGRPEASYVIERLVDAAARATGLPREEIRRRNFIPPDAMPYATALGKVYDSGDFARLLTEALGRSRWAAFEERRAEAKQRGKLRGQGLVYYIEVAGGGNPETAHVHLNGDGGATILIGTQSSGQGHETAYAQMLAGELALPMDKIKVVQGDTDQIPTGGGTAGSRSLPIGGAALSLAIDQVIATGKGIAARLLDAAEDEIGFADGLYSARSSNRTVGVADVAHAALAEGRGLQETATWAPPSGTFPNGCHVVEVEVDPETGQVEIVSYTVVDDVGVVINPLLLYGQIVGGIVQGASQALLEQVVYDEDAQVLTGSFMDYAMPRAGFVPPVDYTTIEIPCQTNLLGIKGAGEAGTIGAAPAVMSALLDALAPVGVTHLDMPATPFAVWQALQQAAQGAGR